MMDEKMKTVVICGVGQLAVEEYPVPACPADKILVRVEACAICTWEQRVYKGINKVEYPFIGGHEIAGRIAQIGAQVDGRIWHAGDKVVCGVITSCDNCPQCKAGDSQACMYFNHSKLQPGMPYHGMAGMSSYYLADPRKCFHYDGIPAVQAALTEPVTCVLHAVEAADIHFGDLVVVIGCGIMGQLNALLAARRGAMVVVSDTNPQRTDLALRLGAKYAINPAQEDLRERVAAISKGEMANVVIDTTPVVSVVTDAIGCLANCGKVVFYSSFHPAVPVPFDPNMVHGHNLQFIGSANSNERDFIRATRLLSEGVVDLAPFVSATYPVEQAQQAFDAACQGDKFRVVLTF